jgi:hypothetical protein
LSGAHLHSIILHKTPVNAIHKREELKTNACFWGE